MGRKTVPLVALLAVLLSIGAYVAWPRHTGGDDLDETDYDGADYDYDADYGDGEFVDVRSCAQLNLGTSRAAQPRSIFDMVQRERMLIATLTIWHERIALCCTVQDGAVVALTKATFDREVLGRKFALVRELMLA